MNLLWQSRFFIDQDNKNGTRHVFLKRIYFQPASGLDLLVYGVEEQSEQGSEWSDVFETQVIVTQYMLDYFAENNQSKNQSPVTKSTVFGE